MARPLHLCYLLSSLDMGGGVKGLRQVVSRQRDWATITVGAKLGGAGQREEDYRQLGISTLRNLQNEDTLREWIGSTRPDVVILRRSGNEHAPDTQILKILKDAGIPAFEINIFGRRDPTTDGFWAGHFHVSRWSMLRYAERLGADPLTLSGHRPLGYAVDAIEPFSVQDRLSARTALGIPADAFVATRLLRPDLRKWDPLPVLAVKRLVQKQPRAMLLVREAPPTNVAWMERQLGSHLLHLPMTRSEEEFRQTLAASDCLLNFSGIGESFGVAIIEGMAAGLPIVTNSQPRLDNAQVEHCEHEVTGLVANTITGVAQALERLATDEALRATLGERARQYSQEFFNADAIDWRIRSFLRSRLESLGDERAEMIPKAAVQSDPYTLTPKWLADFRRREQVLHEEDVRDPLNDRLALGVRRFCNQLGHASKLGWGKAARVLLRRLSRGRISRE